MQASRNALSSVAFSIVAAGVLAMPLASVAQTTAAAPLPPGFRVVLNDDRVSIVESTFAPGVVVPMRNYPRRTVYILKGSSEMKYTYADGRTETLAQETGTVKSRDPEVMSVTNVGATDVVALVLVDKRDLPVKQ
jgi:quercetin dioxygenase-like cupin family protein